MRRYISAKKLIEYIKSRRDGALERQKNLERIGQETVLNEMIAAELNRLISFIDSLQQEQPVEGLEEEIKRMVYDVVYDLNGPAIIGTSEYLSVEDIADIARHFAEWGRKQVLQEIYEGKVKPVDKITAEWLDDELKDKEDK